MTVAVAHQASATGRLALEQAIREAQYRSTDLVVLHVVESIDPDRAEAYRLGISDEVEKAVAQQSDVAWDLRLATAPGGVAEAIMKLVQEVGAELLVIGARRRSPVGKALMGSVAQTLILEADVPVMVVKTP